MLFAMVRGLGAALALAAVSCLPACGDDAPGPAQAGAPRAPGAALEAALSGGAAPAPVVLSVEPSYPDTADGLEALMNALVRAIQSGDAAEKSRLLASLQLPAAEGWFREVFGLEIGPRLLAEYEPQRQGIGWLASHIKGRIETGLASIRAERFDTPGQAGAVGYQSSALARMKQRVPLYSVRFLTPDGLKSWHVWSFIHHQGTFRYVGKMRSVESKTPPSGRDPLEYRPGGAAKTAR